MKRALCLLLITSAAFLMLELGCGKEKVQPRNVPPSIERVSFTDENTNSAVDAGDKIIVAFDRHIIVAANLLTSSVFELSNPSDSFGTSPAITQRSGHALTITLGTSASLTVDGSNYITSQIRIKATVPFGAIKDMTWGTSVTGGGTYNSIEGRLGYKAPRLLSAVYTDVDSSGGLTQGDTITVTFTGNVSVFTAATYPPGQTFVLPVDWDGFGSGAYAQQTAPNTVVITIGSGAKFAVSGLHQVGVYGIDKPSGIDIAIKIANGRLTYDVGGGVKITVPPAVVDIQ
ncbi:MAG: hypothetical protein N2234_06860 [Planctomycetota bacterium]|nr:hypothetical protein [Planctomycetota bacterium]